MFGGAEEGATLESGNMIKVVKEPSVYCGGEWFCDDIETSLPYVETTVRHDWCVEVLMGDDHVVVLAEIEVILKVHLLLEEMTD